MTHFLWGYLKDRVYAGKPHNITELKKSICKEIAAIRVKMLSYTLRAMRHRPLEYFYGDDDHLKDVIFKS